MYPIMLLLLLMVTLMGCDRTGDDDHGDDDVDDDADDDDMEDDDSQPDDDSADDDDSGDDDDAGDDDSGDDDDTSALVDYYSDPLELIGGHTYSVYLLGLAAGIPAVDAVLFDDTIWDPPETLPHVRYVHAAASASNADYYLDGELYEHSGGDIAPGTCSPEPGVYGFSYWELNNPGTWHFAAYEAGDQPGADPPLAPEVAIAMAADEYFSAVLTGIAGNRYLAVIQDDKNPPTEDVVRLGVFHSIEDVLDIDVSITEPVEQVHWHGLAFGSYGAKIELPAGEYELHAVNEL